MAGPYEHNFTMFGQSEYTISPEDLKPISYAFIQGQRFPRVVEKSMGFGIHRSGWTDCIDALSKTGIGAVIDDFVEQTFLARQARTFHDEDFVGFFHYPPDDDLPWFVPTDHDIRYSSMFGTLAWKRSSRRLKHAFTFTQRLAAWLRPFLDCPVTALKHPTSTQVPRWSAANFLANPKIVQVGAFYRDTASIYRLPTRLPKVRILDLRYDWIRQWDELVQKNFPVRDSAAKILHIDRVSAEDYDDIFASSIIHTHYYAASASNVVIECIARKTPLLVNRTPGVVEYLGSEYPLYEDCLLDTPDAMSKLAIEAHKYLQKLACGWLQHDVFIANVRSSLGIDSIRKSV